MRHAPVRGRKTTARRFASNVRNASRLLFERLEERRLLAVDAVNDLVVARANQVASVAASYFQPFSTDTGTGAAFTSVYPEFSGATAVTSVAGGIVITSSGESELYWNGTIPSSDIYTISVDISGNTASPGSYNVGLRIGGNNIVFHPGYGGGAFRVEGNGGFGNQSMPYTPANNLITNMQVTVNKITGLFSIVLTNSQDPTQSHTASFTNLNSVNGPISFHRSGPNVGTAIFDNLVISSASLKSNDISASSLSGGTFTSAKGAVVTINADGTFGYDPRNVAAFKALPFGVTTTDSFTYTAVGADASTDVATVNVTVTGVNDLPTAVNDSYATTEDATLTVAAGAANRLTSNDTDPDTGDVLTVTSYSTTSALGAAVVVNADGSFTYNPASSTILQALMAGVSRVDTFTYSIRDALGGAAPTSATASITVTGVNDAPVATSDTQSTNENTPITGGFALVESFSTLAADLTAFLAAYPQFSYTTTGGGSIAVANGRVETTGAGSFAEQFVIATAHAGETTIYADVGADGSPGNFNVGIRVGNNKIVFHPGYGGAAFRVEGTNSTGNLDIGWTPALDVLHHMKVQISPAGLVTVSLTDGSNPNNVYSLSYNDVSAIGSPIALVRSGNTASKGLYDNLRITWAGALDNDRDAEPGSVLTVSQLNGTASLTGTSTLGAAVTISPQGIWTYNPNVSATLQALPVGATATDTFTYTVSDGVGGTSTGTISIPVAGLNDAPLAGNDSYTTNEDTVLAVSAVAANRLLANDSDVDTGETLTITSYTAVSAKGATVVINADKSFSYNPTSSPTLQRLGAGTTTTDTFTYTITDSQGATASATVTVTVGGINDAPVANSDTQSTNEDTPITGGVSIVETFSTPAADSAAFAAAYPNLSYSTNGGVISVANGRVEITGNSANNEQLVIAGTRPGETTIYFDVSGDSSPGSFNVGLRLGTKKIVFHPGFTGIPGAFRIEGVPGQDGNTSLGWVPALNVLHHMKVQVSPAGLVSVSLTDGSNPNNVYTTTYNDPGAINAQIALLRQGPAGGAKALFDNLRVTWAGALDNDRDADGGTVLTVSQLNGSATLTGTSTLGAAISISPVGVWTYNPTSSAQLQALPVGATVTDTFTYTVSDGAGGTSTATITIPVTGVNDAPVAASDSYATTEDAVLSVSAAAANRLFANDSDVDTGDSFAVSAYTATSAKGAAVVVNADGSFSYNPTLSPVLQALAASASTTDTFTYTIRDSQGATATATVTITVGGLNDAPAFTLTTSSLTVDENTLLSVPNLAAILDADGNETLTYTIVWGDGTANSTGLATIVSTGPTQPTIAGVSGSHTYTDNATYNGLLTVVDSQGIAITMPFVVTVVNAPPTASIDLAPDAGVPWMPLAFAFSATDPSPEDTAAGFTYTVNWGDNSGVQSLADPAEVFHTYKTKGTYTVTVIAYDKDGGASDPVTTVVNITPVVTIDGVLYVGGSLQADRIVISTGVLVRINNVQQPKQAVATKIVVFAGDGADTISVSGTVPPVEIYGGAGDDYLAGGNFADTLDGGAGKDRLIGGSGDDLLLGGSEADTLSGGNGNDTLRGGDTIDYVGGTTLADGSISLPGDIIPAGGLGNDTLNGDAGNDTLIGSENNDGLYGGAGNDLIRGMGGSDMLDGGAGDDLLLGDIGDDKLYGRAGRDALIGGEGRDVLYGSTSADLLFGDYVDDTAPDYLDAMQLWFATFLSSPQTAFDDLTAMALDDGNGDTLYGETDADWYMMFTGIDKFGVSTENKAPNIVRWL